MFFALYEGSVGYYSSGFVINKVYFILIIASIVMFHIRYLSKSVVKNLRKDREHLSHENRLKNTYPKGFPVDSLSYGETGLKFFKWRDYFNFFNVFFVFCMYLFVIIFLYCCSYTVHKYLIPFASYEKQTLTMTTFVCTDKNHSIQTCSVYLYSPKNEQIILSTSPSIAHEFSNKDKVTIEFKHSFIGSSPVKYQ